MSAKSLILWSLLVGLGLVSAIGLRPADVPVSSLDASLGTEVVTEPL